LKIGLPMFFNKTKLIFLELFFLSLIIKDKILFKSFIEKCFFICDKKNEKIYTNYLKDKKKFLVLNNIKDVPKEINKSTKKGDSILIKGSRCWQLEKIIELIN